MKNKVKKVLKKMQLVKDNLHPSDYNHTLAAFTLSDFRVQYQNNKGEYEIEELHELKSDLQARLAFVTEKLIALKSEKLHDNLVKRGLK